MGFNNQKIPISRFQSCNESLGKEYNIFFHHAIVLDFSIRLSPSTLPYRPQWCKNRHYSRKKCHCLAQISNFKDAESSLMRSHLYRRVRFVQYYQKIHTQMISGIRPQGISQTLVSRTLQSLRPFCNFISRLSYFYQMKEHTKLYPFRNFQGLCRRKIEHLSLFSS